jgi:hypothetical protein
LLALGVYVVQLRAGYGKQHGGDYDADNPDYNVTQTHKSKGSTSQENYLTTATLLHLKMSLL